jgi:NADPH:quinone reductase-like Zn-dependent oxidoreductase
MKAARMHSTGAPDVLVLEEVPEPKPGPGEVLVRVESASVNFADVVRRRGAPYPFPSPLPFTPGAEVAGTVVAHGPGVSDPPVGSPVFALLGNGGAGGYAQYAVAPRAQVLSLPAPLDRDFDRACTLDLAGVTALQTLTDCGRLASGETVWIPAAAGGVGSYAVQIARALGAGRVIAGVGSLQKEAFVRSLGAHDVVDYSEPGWTDRVKEITGRRGVDVALEMAGGAMLERTLSVLAPYGRLVHYGTASGERTAFDPSRLIPFNATIVGYYVSAWFAQRPQRAAAAFQQLVALVQSGQVDVQVGKALPLGEAAAAHRALESRAGQGKSVLKPWLQDAR